MDRLTIRNTAVASELNIKDTVLSLKRKGFFLLKRTFDVFFSLIGCIALLPIALVIKVSYLLSGDKHSIFFTQVRTGKNGENFNLYKFRSMAIDNNVRDFSKEDQYTKVGKIIRKLSIDELPQMINILKGDMSFIGPRPWIPEYYENMNVVQRHRCDVVPGISGLAQVMGRNNISIFDKINYDLQYVKNASIFQDLKIIFLTIKTVFVHEGVNAGKSTIQNELNDLKIQNNK